MKCRCGRPATFVQPKTGRVTANKDHDMCRQCWERMEQRRARHPDLIYRAKGVTHVRMRDGTTIQVGQDDEAALRRAAKLIVANQKLDLQAEMKALEDRIFQLAPGEAAIIMSLMDALTPLFPKFTGATEDEVIAIIKGSMDTFCKDFTDERAIQKLHEASQHLQGK